MFEYSIDPKHSHSNGTECKSESNGEKPGPKQLAKYMPQVNINGCCWMKSKDESSDYDDVDADINNMMKFRASSFNRCHFRMSHSDDMKDQNNEELHSNSRANESTQNTIFSECFIRK